MAQRIDAAFLRCEVKQIMKSSMDSSEGTAQGFPYRWQEVEALAQQVLERFLTCRKYKGGLASPQRGRG